MFRLLCCAVLAAVGHVVMCLDEAEDRSSEVHYQYKRHYGYAPAPVDPLLLPLGHGHHDYHHSSSHHEGPLGHHSVSHGYSDYVGPVHAGPVHPITPPVSFLAPKHHGHQVIIIPYTPFLKKLNPFLKSFNPDNEKHAECSLWMITAIASYYSTTALPKFY